VLVDGPPALRPMPGSDVERVINSRALILKVGNVFYLNASDHWYEASDVGGRWTLIPIPPAFLDAAKQTAMASQSVDLMPPGTNAVTTTPAIFVSTVPAELIQTEGPPNLVPIEGTELMQVQNSDNALFFSDPIQRYYVLISGRWFNASSLEGPWGFVPYKELPKDFDKIPPTHPKANALDPPDGHGATQRSEAGIDLRRRTTVQAHCRHSAALRDQYRHACHRSGRAHLLQRAKRRVVCSGITDRTMARRDKCACGHLYDPGQFAAALCDLRAGLRLDA
jgi:hypothetical protein